MTKSLVDWARNGVSQTRRAALSCPLEVQAWRQAAVFLAGETKTKRTEEGQKKDGKWAIKRSSCTRITLVASALRIKGNRPGLAHDWREGLCVKGFGVICWD